MKEASENRETISSRGRYERQRESERKHLIMSRRRRTTRSREEEEERADEDEDGTTTNSESSSRGDDDPTTTTTRRGGDDVDEMLLNHNNNNNNNNAYDVGEEEEDEEEELGYNRFGSVAAGGGGRGRRGRPPLRRNTSDSEEELRRQQQQQRGRGHAPSSEDDDDEELSRSDNDTQMSVDSDTEGRGGLVDSAYNNDLNANTRRRARETHKNYVDAQLANAAGGKQKERKGGVSVYNNKVGGALPVVVVVVLTLCPRRLPLRRKTKARKFYQLSSNRAFSRWMNSTRLSWRITRIGTCEITKGTIRRRCCRA